MFKNTDKRKTEIRIVVLFLAGSAIELLYGYINFFIRNYRSMALANVLAAALIIGCLIFLLLTKKKKVTYLAGLIICSAHFIYIVLFGYGNELSPFWILIIPHIVYYTNGARKGSFFSLLVFLVFLTAILIQIAGIYSFPYPPYVFRDLSLVFFIVSLMTYIYEKSLEEKQKHLEFQLNFDKMTDLPNRNRMLKFLETNRNEQALILINIDKFREINDIYGSRQGDMVLKELAYRLLSLNEKVPKGELYKLHADEFAFIFPIAQKQFERSLNTIIREIRNKSRYDFKIGDAGIYISLTMGIARGRKNHLAHADSALRLARAQHKNYVIHSDSIDMTGEYRKNIKQTSKLRNIMNKGGVVPFFQPIMDNKTGRINKYECLMRFRDGEEFLLPGQFLELSKRSKIYGALTRTMISRCFRYFENRKEDFSINICLEDIFDETTTNHIYRQLEKYGLGKRLIFEFLESSRIEGNPQVESFIRKVKEYGCRIAIDDFGAGYSNFEYLLRMEFDFLKIDSSLIRNLDRDRNSRIMVETIVSFSRKLGLKTIAEYVHNEEISLLIREMGIDFSQGYFIGEPSDRAVKKGMELISRGK
ncbi:GGDEF domain-containing phosphodiesterase [Spirochaeta isovalerica]|uniref:Diguanylate cyclase (GGDEF)-like protein n=1 Tax=Spirochaeta isovalerica TaxID=150 RepID=A0A841R2V3_9SPIO|nr:GGDEF domain-containing phosphodiesterase [Spirochaeta isovalerica]MBB6479364.1 diguanylate cyclase (GGDEF)-like protein [Spirochaeta isovalerica]